MRRTVPSQLGPPQRFHKSRVGAALVATVLVLPARSALAQATSTAPDLVAQGEAVLGERSVGATWTSYGIRLSNLGDEPRDGWLELASTQSWSRPAERILIRAPFAVAARTAISIELPARSTEISSTTELVIRDGQSREISRHNISTSPAREGLVVAELSLPPRLRSVLQGLEYWDGSSGSTSSSHRYSYSTPTISLGGPQVNAATGEAALPEHAATYAGITLAIIKSEDLARLKGGRLTALTDWLMAGGALAVILTRPEDRRSPTVKALLGGEAVPSTRRPEQTAESLFTVPAAKDPDQARAQTRFEQRMIGPVSAVAQQFTSYSGGNLRDTLWGSSATYGLGEIHLLPFDPTREPALSDEWVHQRLAQLTRHAQLRQSQRLAPLASLPLDTAIDDIRRIIDPNERSRWAIGAATLLLILYAVLAGPWNFHRAARAGKPLRALLILPIASLGTLILVVLIGIGSRGIFGQARHLTLVEAGAGMPRGSAIRYRGFYAPSANQLTIRGSDPTSVLDLAGPSHDIPRQLVVDRDGMRIERILSSPWQTVIAREDGFASLGRGVSLVDRDGKLLVKNRLGRALAGVLVWNGTEARHFQHIADGSEVAADTGDPMVITSGTQGSSSHHFPSDFDDRVERDVNGLGRAWTALYEIARTDLVFWTDVPVLIGQMVGGEGRTNDSGFPLKEDRVLLRVVGWGGEI